MNATRRYSLAGTLGVLCLLVAIPEGDAQSSASYKLEETSINSGGHPDGGVILSSASFRITQDSVGESLGMAQLQGATFRIEGGFLNLNPPPVEVTNLRFNDATTFAWDPQPAAEYEVYRGALNSLPGTFGICFANDVFLESAMDGTVPSSGAGYFYLVTARNRLLEESVKGFSSNGTLQGNPAPCP